MYMICNTCGKKFWVAKDVKYPQCPNCSSHDVLLAPAVIHDKYEDITQTAFYEDIS